MRVSGGSLVVCVCARARVCVCVVPAGSPSRGGDVTVYCCDINQPSLPTPFYSVLVSISVFMALSVVISFHKFSRQLSAFSLCSSLFCLVGPFNYVSLYGSLPQL